ncbi:hypothetical protein HYH03_018650 [Edaphochlamys debaryana]|uniref:Nucleotide-diphospho-sugar transferase domain-containing protein n=1 Tax=Edaphochlamys debaryana TaxID=47281 RepID=A0A835XFL0_9CHLO|nr:hypothetical protein HYH03_018650 [Edaphochlamys debaryana]|eukprot:KAG2482415.1 hypothetical protein HYH03_018650 [Edaphochlamys debaryana]
MVTDSWYEVPGPFAFVKRLTDLVSLGYDVLWFEPDRVWFRHPLAWLVPYADSVGADVLLPSPTCQEPAPGSGVDPRPVHLDLIYIRSTPGTVRCMYQWVWYLSSAQVTSHDHVLSAEHFATALNKCLDYVSIRYLPTSAFPPFCAGRCGCNAGAPVGEPGTGSVLDANGTPTVSCAREQAREWVSMAFTCVHPVAARAAHMDAYTRLYNATVHPIGEEDYKQAFKEPYAFTLPWRRRRMHRRR